MVTEEVMESQEELSTSSTARETGCAGDGSREEAWPESDDDIIAEWLRGRPAHTLRAYRTAITRFRTTVTKPLIAVTLTDLRGYADVLVAAGLAPASQRRLLAAVKSLFSFAQMSGYLPANAGRTLRLPTVRGRLAERIPSEDDVLALLASEPNPRNHAFIRLLYSAGLRLSEARALRWRDLQPRGDAGQVAVWGKGEKERIVLISAGTWSEVMALRPAPIAPDDAVFPSRHGGTLSTTQAWRIVKTAAAQATLSTKLSPHWLRHAHASHALDHGAPVSLVRDGLGHSSLLTTSQYAHARPGDGASRYLPV